MSEAVVPSRTEAIEILRADRKRTDALLAGLGPSDMERIGLGGGDWAPKDLVGHLETWEQHALDALVAWDRGEVAPVAAALDTLGTDEVNRREVERKAGMSTESIATSAAATHERLLDALAALDDDRWAASPEPDDDDTIGRMVGGILGGTQGLFRHDPDHWPDLETFPAG
jgi:Mycothiol maleylpyruvate isomerase N-terminal domain